MEIIAIVANIVGCWAGVNGLVAVVRRWCRGQRERRRREEEIELMRVWIEGMSKVRTRIEI